MRVSTLLQHLGLSRSTYYQWMGRAQDGRLADRLGRTPRSTLPPTPDQRAAVCGFALAHPIMGYER